MTIADKLGAVMAVCVAVILMSATACVSLLMFSKTFKVLLA